MEKDRAVYAIDDQNRLLGTCSKHPDGWVFIPHVAGRRSSTKYWPTKYHCVPRWAAKAFEKFITYDEFKVLYAGGVK